MPDPNVEIFTLQMKRIFQGLKNLRDGITASKDFSTEHNIPSLLNVAKNLPTGFQKADYAPLDNLLADLTVVYNNYVATGQKFVSYTPEGISDPLDMLGKRFYVIGG